MTLEASLDHSLPDFHLQVRFQASAKGITALFGPSGAGKSLTLRHLAGLERGTRGRIVLGERVLFDAPSGLWLPAQARRIGLVFQEYALFPHLDVAGNIGYGLHRLGRAERASRVEGLLELVGLEGYGGRRVRSLSGGERQRVAIARALAPEPELLLLDEPFAALDFRVRRELRLALAEIQRRAAVPTVLVTHALEDVRVLADDVVLMDRGRVVAQGATSDLLDRPPSPEAAALVSTDVSA